MINQDHLLAGTNKVPTNYGVNDECTKDERSILNTFTLFLLTQIQVI